MRLEHKITIKKSQRILFLMFGIDILDYEDDVTQWASFVVVTLWDDDPKWRIVRRLANVKRPFHSVETIFSSAELLAASSLCFESESFGDYPQPLNGNSWRSLAYDLSSYCDACGAGAIQKAPFRMESEVIWEERQTTQLYFIQDEVFVPPVVWESVFQPEGIGFWPVHSAQGETLGGVVQLKIDSFTELQLPPNLDHKTCASCGRIKFSPHLVGLWPKTVSSAFKLAKSSEYFGFGHEAFHLLFVNHSLYVRMEAQNINCKYWVSVG